MTESVRLDKWLWMARFARTRTLATALAVEGRVRIDGQPTIKAHAAIRPGQVLTFVQGRHIRVVRVLALGARRGPAREAQLLYEDLAPPSVETALPRDPGAPLPGDRASSRERRQARRLKEGGAS